MDEEIRLDEIKEESYKVKLGEVIRETLRHWPWIIISVILCVGIAVLMVLRTHPGYARSAAIIVKDDKGGSSGGFDLSGLADLGFMSSNTNLHDEVNKLKSRDVRREVISRLDLQTNYWEEGTFHDKVLYGADVPVKVTFSPGFDDRTAEFKLKIKDAGSYELSKGMLNDPLTKQKFEIKEGTYKFGQDIKTPFGAISIEKTPAFKADYDKNIIVNRSTFDSTLKGLDAKIGITYKRNEGNTVEISVKDLSPKRGDDIISTIIDVYNERWIDSRNQIAMSTNAFIDDRLRMIEMELGNVENDISDFQSKNLIPDMQRSTMLYMDENRSNESAIITLANQLQITKFMRDFIADNTENQVLPANVGLENRGIEEQIKVYNELALQRKQYAANSSETHPMVVNIDAQLSDMRSSIGEALDNQIMMLNTRMKSLSASKSKAQNRLEAAPSQAKYLLSVERQQKVKETLYLYLLEKREENQLSQAFTAYNTEIIAKPYGEMKPYTPRMIRSIGIAFLIGLFLPFGAEYLYLTNNNKIRTRKDLEKLKAPLLGEIPEYKFPKSDKDHTEIVVKQGERDLVNESFRLLRTDLKFIAGNKSHGCETIMFTSFIPGSGKTFIAVNLGATFALKGMKTLVIDCDLRRATASDYVNSPKRGISDYLVGNVSDINDVIVSGQLAPNLDMIPVGTIPPNPAELLESEAFSRLVASMREKYDYILIDCPPIEMMADAQLVNEVSNRTVFVIKSGALERSMVGELNDIFRQSKFKNLAVVLNAVKVQNSGYGTYRKHGYGYSYGSTK